MKSSSIERKYYVERLVVGGVILVVSIIHVLFAVLDAPTVAKASSFSSSFVAWAVYWFKFHNKTWDVRKDRFIRFVSKYGGNVEHDDRTVFFSYESKKNEFKYAVSASLTKASTYDINAYVYDEPTRDVLRISNSTVPRVVNDCIEADVTEAFEIVTNRVKTKIEEKESYELE